MVSREEALVVLVGVIQFPRNTRVASCNAADGAVRVLSTDDGVICRVKVKDYNVARLGNGGVWDEGVAIGADGDGVD